MINAIVARRRMLLVVLSMIAAGVALLLLPILDWSIASDAWIAEHFWIGLLLYIVLLCLWSLLVPTAVPILLAGYFFGFWIGIVATYIATTTSFLIAFSSTRVFFRERVHHYLSQRPRLQRFVDSLEASGWKLVVWMRISPLIPFHLQNYCYGASSMRFSTCLWATLLGKLPGVSVTVLIGVVIKESAASLHGIDDMQRPWWWTGFLMLATLAVIVVSWMLMRAGRVALKHQAD